MPNTLSINQLARQARLVPPGEPKLNLWQLYLDYAQHLKRVSEHDGRLPCQRHLRRQWVNQTCCQQHRALKAEFAQLLDRAQAATTVHWGRSQAEISLLGKKWWIEHGFWHLPHPTEYDAIID